VASSLRLPDGFLIRSFPGEKKISRMTPLSLADGRLAHRTQFSRSPAKHSTALRSADACIYSQRISLEGRISHENGREYRVMADECFKWARKARADEVRVSLLQLAQVWLDAATKLEGLFLTQTKSAPDELSKRAFGRSTGDRDSHSRRDKKSGLMIT
jgi:hypothetical protein